MSTTPEALAPQSELELDAPVTATPPLPDGQEQKTADVADPSPAAKPDSSDTPEPEATWVQKRINELTRDRREAERRERDSAKERDHWRELALKNQPQPKAPEPEKPKSLADFQFDDGQYQQYLISKAADAARKAAKEELAQEQTAAEKQRKTVEYATKVREFVKDHPDYREVAEFAPISDNVADIILGLESGPEIAYYLGKNPDAAVQISSLPDQRAAYEIGQIAARLEFEKSKVQSARSLISSAPPPTPKLEGVNPVVQKEPKDMTQPEYNKWRRKQIAARKGWSSSE